MNSLYQTTLSFTSQNLGAKQYRRIDRILVCCMTLVVLIGVVLGQGAYRLGDRCCISIRRTRRSLPTAFSASAW